MGETVKAILNLVVAQNSIPCGDTLSQKMRTKKPVHLTGFLVISWGFQNFVLAGCPPEKQSLFIEYGLLAFAPVLARYETPRLSHADGCMMPDARIKSKVC